jgi:type IV secretion system protein VirB2
MKTSTKELSSAWQMSLLMLLAAVAIMLPDLAFAETGVSVATGDTVIAAAFCNVIGWFTGTTGKGIATIAIIVIGVGALMGKVSWGMAIIVGIGIALIFGAASLVNNIAGSHSDISTCSAGTGTAT